MLFYSFFKSLVGKDVIVELKNDLSICGTLDSVDQVGHIGEHNESFVDLALLLLKNVPLFQHSDMADGHMLPVEEFLNIKLTDISVTDPEKYPHMLSVKNCFIRGSVVRYVQLPAEEVDVQLLQDATRKEATQTKT